MLKTNQHTFINADCMDYLPEFKDNHFDLAIVDPPYGIGKFWSGGDSKNFNYRKDQQINSEWNENIPDKIYFRELKRASKNVIIWGWNYYTEYLGSSESLIFWDKCMGAPNYSSGEIAYTSFGHKLKYYKLARNSERHGLAIHPCQKPVQLYRWLLQNYAKPGDLILDTHVGSGSSLVACIMEGFDYIGYEIDKEYYDGATKRIKAEMQKIDMFKCHAPDD